jgi:hypothetical protein
VNAAILLTTINAKWIHPSLALRLLKANLGALEPRSEILEFALRQPLVEKLAALRSRRPQILGISVSIWNHRATLELLAALEQEWSGTMPGSVTAPGAPSADVSGSVTAPGALSADVSGSVTAPSTLFTDLSGSVTAPTIVLGGPEVSFLPADAEIFRHADYVIRGEGEIAFRELCEALLDNAAFSGLATGGNAAPRHATHSGNTTTPRSITPPGETAPRNPPRFIDAAPVDVTRLRPAYHYYTGEDLTRKLVYVESSRGCP